MYLRSQLDMSRLCLFFKLSFSSTSPPMKMIILCQHFKRNKSEDKQSPLFVNHNLQKKILHFESTNFCRSRIWSSNNESQSNLSMNPERMLHMNFFLSRLSLCLQTKLIQKVFIPTLIKLGKTQLNTTNVDFCWLSWIVDF